MDEADISQARMEIEEAILLEAYHYDLEQGTPGECDLCGEHSMRLIKGACAPCRDKYHLE